MKGPLLAGNSQDLTTRCVTNQNLSPKYRLSPMGSAAGDLVKGKMRNVISSEVLLNATKSRSFQI
jgi:hypothetical protein